MGLQQRFLRRLWVRGSVAKRGTALLGHPPVLGGCWGHWVSAHSVTVVGACLVFGGRQLQGLVQACVTTATYQKWSEAVIEAGEDVEAPVLASSSTDPVNLGA